MAGPVPKDVLVNKAKVLAIKAFDTYNPDKGAALSTHVINNLAPISRVVYTHQNAARLPENLTMKVNAYNTAKENLSVTLGRQPSDMELHQELGWSAPEVNRMSQYMRNDLVESIGGLDDSFYSDQEAEDDDLLAAIYFDLSPEEKELFVRVTGYLNHPKQNNSEIIRDLGISQAQLSYRKTLLLKKINRLTENKR